MYLVMNERTRQLTGAFCADNTADLFAQVEQRTDPFTCVYLKLQPGEGLFLDDDLLGDGAADALCIPAGPSVPTAAPTAALQSRFRGPAAWRRFTLQDFAASYGMPVESLASPRFRAQVKESLGLSVQAC